MKLFYALIILIFFQNCSFDNKSGIWKNTQTESVEENNLFKEFETLKSSEQEFNKKVNLKKNFKFKIKKPSDNYNWKDIFYSENNNYKNFKYNELNQIIFTSKKITKYKVNNLLFEDTNLIISDVKGNIIIFSVSDNKIISKLNFYKKKYKKINKILNLIVENNIIYISDNLGYLYAYNYKKNKIIWAKNYKIPFRSNLKIYNNFLIASDQNNNLIFYNKNDGTIKKSIPTEETIIKNNFVNNLSLFEETLYFLNTYGSLYSIDLSTSRISWFINLNRSLDLNPSNLFNGNEIIGLKNKLIVSSDQFTYVINRNNGFITHKKNYVSIIKPILIDDYIFSISKNNLLIAMNLSTGEIIYSYDINQKIANFLNTKKHKVEFKKIMLLNNKIFIFLKNSYVIKLNLRGEIESLLKLSSKLNTDPIVINSSLLYLNKKNKLTIFN